MWKKVIAPTLLVCVCWVVVSGTTTYGIYRLSRVHENILTENVASIRAAGGLQESIWRLQAAFLDFLDDGGGEAGSTEFDRLEAEFGEALALAKKSSVTTTETDLVATIHERFIAYRDLIHDNLNLDRHDAKKMIAMGDEAAKLAGRLAESCSAYLEINERLMTEAAARGARMERMLYLIRLVFLVAGPLLGIYVGLRMARNLQSSISRISVTLNDTSGELDQEIGSVNVSPHGNPDELSRLNDQVQAISGRIRQVLSELQKARQDVLRADRLAVVGELAAGVAHELRNPLTSVKLLIQTAPRTDGNQQQAGIQLQDRHAGVVLQEISRMEETISTLLDFARPAKLHRVRHDLRETIRRALSLVEGRAKQAGVVVRATLPDMPVFVDGDPDQLHQVFGNLLINGIESMAAGGTLEVTADSGVKEPGFATVTVVDGGSGIPQQVLDRIFEPFLTTKERGIGLGLAVTRRIVQEHGGRIFASNQAAGGAVFTVELPSVPPVGDLAQGLSRSNGDSGLDAALAGFANPVPR